MFQGKQENNQELKNLQIGYFLTYRNEEYEAVSENIYQYAEDIVLEWELLSFNKSMLLQYFEATDRWYINFEVPFRILNPNLMVSIETKGRPSKELDYNNLSYIIEEKKVGKLSVHNNLKKEEFDVTSWIYTNNFDSTILTINRLKTRSDEKKYVCYSASPINKKKLSNISDF